MKKFFKAILALALIAGLAFGAYFIFFKKDNGKLVHENVYNLTYNIVDAENKVNIFDNVNATIVEMRHLAISQNMGIAEAQNGLQGFLDIKAYYDSINSHVLKNGSLIVDNNIGQYVAKASESYGKIVEIYKTAYAYLQDTYYEIDDKIAYAETVKSYIVNFYNIFKDLIPEYNSFGYYTGLAYAHGVQNTMYQNNFYKLKVEYYAEVVNQYYLSETAKTALGAEAARVKLSLNNNFSSKYFNNKDIYDGLISKSQTLKVGDLALKIVNLEIDNYIASLATEEDRKEIQNYVTYVARG